jgi:hypothetical protein
MLKKPKKESNAKKAGAPDGPASIRKTEESIRKKRGVTHKRLHASKRKHDNLECLTRKNKAINNGIKKMTLIPISWRKKTTPIFNTDFADMIKISRNGKNRITFKTKMIIRSAFEKLGDCFFSTACMF